MQAVGKTSAGHDTTRERVDDHNLSVLRDNIIHVSLHNAVRVERLLNVMIDRHIFGIGKIFDRKKFLCLRNAVLSQNGALGLLIHDIILSHVLIVGLGIHFLYDMRTQTAHEFFRRLIKLVGLRALSRNDERGSRFVDQDRVHLVHDRKRIAALCQIALENDHVIAQIVKADLVVRSVSNICRVSRLLFLGTLSVNDQARRQTEKCVNLAHFLAVTSGKVIVDRNDMHAFSRQRVQICGHGCNESLTFTRFHFRNAALMKDDTAHQLYAEGAFAENTVRRFTARREGVRQNIVKRFARRKSFLQKRRGAAQFFVAHGFIRIGKRLDFIYDRLDFFDLSFTVCAK